MLKAFLNAAAIFKVDLVKGRLINLYIESFKDFESLFFFGGFFSVRIFLYLEEAHEVLKDGNSVGYLFHPGVT